MNEMEQDKESSPLLDLLLNMYKSTIPEGVWLNSDECTLYQTEHGSCKGCSHLLGCKKYNAIALLLVFGGSMGKGLSIDAQWAIADEVSGLQHRIAKAANIDEITGILREGLTKGSNIHTKGGINEVPEC